jgi:phosphatidylglycerol:prolipoprotein diacylglycerol transferase
MIALGFLTFLYLTIRHPLRKKLIDKEAYLNLVFLGLISGVVGGRILYIISAPQDFADNWIEIFYPWIGGFVVLGSIIGVLVTVPLYLYKHHVPALPVLDLAATYAPIMQSIARFGCLGAGCCYGATAPDLPWAITFTSPYSIAPIHVPLHPTQIYTSIASLCIFFIVWGLSKKLFSKPGTTLFLYLILENIARFTIDFWRGDRHPIIASWYNGSITISQVQTYSIMGLIIAVVGFVILWSRKK